VACGWSRYHSLACRRRHAAIWHFMIGTAVHDPLLRPSEMGTALYGGRSDPNFSAAFQNRNISSSIRMRSRERSLVGGFNPAIGLISIMPRSRDHANSFLIAASARFALNGAPLAMMSSKMRTMSGRLI